MTDDERSLLLECARILAYMGVDQIQGPLIKVDDRPKLPEFYHLIRKVFPDCMIEKLEPKEKSL